MKYFELTIAKWSRVSCLALICMMLTYLNIYSQNNTCSLACNGHLNVTMDENCEALITADEVLNGQDTSCPGVDIDDFIVTVSNQYGEINNPVGSDYIGQDLYVKVQDPGSGNSCWGTLSIKDELGPQVDGGCPTTVSDISCFELSFYEGPTFIDACEGIKETVLVSEDIDPYDCDDTYIKYVERTYTAYDSRNTRGLDCVIRFNVLRLDTNEIICPADYTEFVLAEGCVNNMGTLSCDGQWKEGQGNGVDDTDTDGDGILDADLTWDDNGNEYPDPLEVGVPYLVTMINGELDTIALYPYPDIYCNAVIYYRDVEYPEIDCKKKINRLWTINEWHCNDNIPYTIKQVIEINDDESPEVVCQDIIRMTTNAITGSSNSSYGSVNCGASLSIPLPSATDNCSDSFRYDISYPGYSQNHYDGSQSVLLPMGETEVNIRVWDNCYNSTTCTTTVVVEDQTPPVAVCDQFTAVSLTTGGRAVVNATSFDDGSYDDCKTHCMLVSRMTPDGCDCNVPTFCDLDYIGEYEGSYYYISDYRINAEVAKNRAFAYGGSLAILESSVEQEWLLSEIRKSFTGSFWIGMKNLGANYLWDDHESLSFTNWADASPSGNGCVLMNSDNEWQDVSCFEEERYILEIKDICGFSKTAAFCCSDVGTDQMVTFRVIDIFGNFNDCMVSVDVQDKVAPSLICPPNETVNCDTPLDFQNLSALYGDAIVSDDCGATLDETGIDETTECNLGSYTRVFTATDDEGRQSTCKQVLTFVNPYPTNDPDFFTCPRDTVIIGCMSPDDLSPDVFGYPGFNVEPCGLIGTDWDDEVFTFNSATNGPTCFKILRNWEVIDWCEPNLPVSTCVQVIKITNGDRPEIDGISTLEECTFDAQCNEGFIELKVTGSDECTDSTSLRWKYEVYGGELGVGPRSFSSPVASGSGEGFEADASGTYPVGTHIVRWTFLDLCGNATTRDQEFTILNCKAPTAYCLNGLAVNLMPVDLSGDEEEDFAMVELWATDFDAGSFHSCGYEVELSFSPDEYVPNISFDCTTRGDQDVTIYVTAIGPTGEEFQSSCTSTVNVQDNNNACQGQKDVLVTVGGNIFTEDLENVGEVQVVLEGSPLYGKTDSNGNYAFPEMPTGGDYIIHPYYNEDPLNGVSTLDIIEIQRHVLGLEPITSPYKLIAADINKDFRISAQDLLELRKLILGIYDEFPNNTSWRFIDNAYEFLDPLNPFYEDFKEDYLISNLSGDMYVDFVAIKVGDVNDNSVGSAQGQTSDLESFNSTTELQIDDSEFNAGDFVSIPVNVNRDDIRGMQFTLKYDNNLMDIESIESDINGFTSKNYRITHDGVIISWNVADKMSDRTVFTINAIAKSSGSVTEVFDISSSLIHAEVYDNEGNISKPVITGKNGSAESKFDLFQNTPNPFADNTEIRFSLEKSSQVQLTVSDVQGRVVHSNMAYFEKGIQAYTINADELGGAGVYYMTVSTPDNSATIKMVVIR